MHYAQSYGSDNYIQIHWTCKLIKAASKVQILKIEHVYPVRKIWPWNIYSPWRRRWWERPPSWFSWDSPIRPSRRGMSGAVSSGRRTRTLSCPRSIPHWFPGCNFMNFNPLFLSHSVRKLTSSKHILMDRKGWPIQSMNIVPHKILHLPHSFWVGYAWPPPTLCWLQCCFRRHQGHPRSPPSCNRAAILMYIS